MNLITLAETGGDQLLPTVLMGAGVLLLAILVLGNVRRKIKRNSTNHLDANERVERIRQQQGMRDDLREMMVELEEMARRFGAQLDAKAIYLEKLLDQADERMLALRRLEPNRGLDSPPTDSNDDGMANSQAGVLQATDAVRTSNVESAAVAAVDTEVDPLVEKIYKMADEGQTPIEIARNLDEQIGKVELILALRQ